MNDHAVIYTNKQNCTGCFRCIRNCPVKAMAVFTDDKADIDPDKCVACGTCYSVCKYGAIGMHEDIALARKLIKTDGVKVASVSSQWMTEFEGIDRNRFVEALTLLGFDVVSESAHAARLFIEKENEWIESNGTAGISSRCPALIRYIYAHRPQYKNLIIPVASPMLLHARMARGWWGQDITVIHFSACAADKTEALYSDGEVNAVITFPELKKWLKEEGIGFDKISGGSGYSFQPSEAGAGHDYIIPESERIGGVRTDKMVLSVSGIYRIEQYLDSLMSVSDRPIKLDFSICPGGCLGSHFSTADSRTIFKRKFTLLNFEADRRNGQALTAPVTGAVLRYEPYRPSMEPAREFVSESETYKALEDIGLISAARQSDCGACGFGTCRRFAKALSRGQVVREMCVHYLRRELSSKFDTLLDKLSSGVAIVNNESVIEAANRTLARMLGPDAELIYNNDPGFRGLKADELLPFSALVSNILESGEDTIVRDVQVKDRIVTVSVHTIQRHRTALVICRNLLFSQVRNEEIVSRTQKVINDNLETVQKIAYLLGENASRTEAILNSILKAEQPGDEN